MYASRFYNPKDRATWTAYEDEDFEDSEDIVSSKQHMISATHGQLMRLSSAKISPSIVPAVPTTANASTGAFRSGRSVDVGTNTFGGTDASTSTFGGRSVDVSTNTFGGTEASTNTFGGGASVDASTNTFGGTDASTNTFGGGASVDASTNTFGGTDASTNTFGGGASVDSGTKSFYEEDVTPLEGSTEESDTTPKISVPNDNKWQAFLKKVARTCGMSIDSFDFALAMLEEGLDSSENRLSPLQIYRRLQQSIAGHERTLQTAETEQEQERVGQLLVESKKTLSESELGKQLHTKVSFLASPRVRATIEAGFETLARLIPLNLSIAKPKDADTLLREMAWYCSHFAEYDLENAVQFYVWLRFCQRENILEMLRMLYILVSLSPEQLNDIKFSLSARFNGWSREDLYRFDLGKEDDVKERDREEQSRKLQILDATPALLFPEADLSALQRSEINRLVANTMSKYRHMVTKPGATVWLVNSFLAEAQNFNSTNVVAEKRWNGQFKQVQARRPQCLHFLPLFYYMHILYEPTAESSLKYVVDSPEFEQLLTSVVGNLNVTVDEVVLEDGSLDEDALVGLWVQRLSSQNCSLVPQKAVLLIPPVVDAAVTPSEVPLSRIQTMFPTIQPAPRKNPRTPAKMDGSIGDVLNSLPQQQQQPPRPSMAKLFSKKAEAKADTKKPLPGKLKISPAVQAMLDRQFSAAK
jgi:hypothetical protein